MNYSRFFFISIIIGYSLILALAVPGKLIGSDKTGDTRIIGSIEFVYIPKGKFLMGTPENEGKPDEHPQHNVFINAFWISKYEITQGQYLFSCNQLQWEDDEAKIAFGTSYFSSAESFCRIFSSNNNVRCRLPTEAEWEYACRAGTTTKFYWGNEINTNYFVLPDSNVRFQKVGKKKSNAWGLYDMIGNAPEWCQDRYNANYYSMSVVTNPAGPPSGIYSVIRGGSVLWMLENGSFEIDSKKSWYRSADRRFAKDGEDPKGLRLVITTLELEVR